MGEITALGAELPRAASILHENASAVLALDRIQLLPGHLLRMSCPPCNTALRRAEALLSMPGGLLKHSITLRATVGMNDSFGCRHRLCRHRVTLAVGLDSIDGYTERRSNLTEAGAVCPEL